MYLLKEGEFKRIKRFKSSESRLWLYKSWPRFRALQESDQLTQILPLDGRRRDENARLQRINSLGHNICSAYHRFLLRSAQCAEILKGFSENIYHFLEVSQVRENVRNRRLLQSDFRRRLFIFNERSWLANFRLHF